MTCQYDGRLVSGPGGLEPCCADMHRLIIAKVVYQGKLTVRGGPALLVPKVREDGKQGITLSECPFCGAGADVRDVNGVAIGGDRRVTVRVTAEELAAIDRVAELEGISRSEVVRRAIAAYIENGKEVNQ